MTKTETLKAEIRELERRIKEAKESVTQLSAEFAVSNDQLAQMHLVRAGQARPG